MIAWGRLVYGGASLLVAIACGWYGADWIKGNKDALSAILTVFSILGGFLIALIGLTADDRGLRGSTWRAKHYNVKTIRMRLLRHRMLFSIYLIACFLAFASSLKLPLSDIPLMWLNRATLGVAVFSFLLSFGLPHNLAVEYLKRLDQAVTDARQASSSPTETKHVDDDPAAHGG